MNTGSICSDYSVNRFMNDQNVNVSLLRDMNLDNSI